jgi:hypothetical protein
MTSRLWLLGAALTLSACHEDPYLLRSFGDGWANRDGSSRETFMPPDAGPTDAKPPPPERRGMDMSFDACRARLEVCNNEDDNCDGVADEGFDKQGDPRYCEDCQGCMWLLQQNAYPGCSQGKCTIGSCVGGFVDQNGGVADGCEYKCTPSGIEICDGLDNDCNGQVDDNLLLPQSICRALGPCQGAQAVCKGAQGWQCEYGPEVELHPCAKDQDCGAGNICDTAKGVCPGVVILEERKCDGKDGDCDGVADDPWVTVLGKGCELDSPPKKGICRNVGQLGCDPVTQDKVLCTLVTPGQAPKLETCNGLDDDCDGVVDNLDLAQNPGTEEWVTAGTFKIFKYEATRPDGTSTSAGIASTGRPCSVPGRLPWAVVTKEEAQAACGRAGARLCTSTEWMKACRGQSNTLYPYGAAFSASACNGYAYSASPAVLPTDQPATCVSDWGSAGTIFDMSGNVKEWTSVTTGYEIRGGAYDTPSISGFSAGLSCDYVLPAPPSALRLPTLGFRCCK